MSTFRGSGTPVSGADIYDQSDLDAAVADALAQATAAAASAAAASTSETNAAASETNAAASEANAATSETNAATSETNAAASASAAATSETNAAASEAAAAASYDSFDDRYLGAKASDPTLDNDGNPLLTGAMYWNTTNNIMRIYDGAAWGDIGRATANVTEWTVSSTQTTFTGNDDNGLTLSYVPGYLMVFQNGTLLDPDDYTATTGTSVVLDVAAESGDTVNMIGFGTFDVSTSYTKTEADARFGRLSFANTFTAANTFTGSVTTQSGLNLVQGSGHAQFFATGASDTNDYWTLDAYLDEYRGLFWDDSASAFRQFLSVSSGVTSKLSLGGSRLKWGDGTAAPNIILQDPTQTNKNYGFLCSGGNWLMCQYNDNESVAAYPLVLYAGAPSSSLNLLSTGIVQAPNGFSDGGVHYGYNSTYGQYGFSWGKDGNYFLLSTSTGSTYITAAASGTIYLRPGFNDGTNEMAITASGFSKSGEQQMSFHGRLAAAGGSIRLPSGWSTTKLGTGWYRVTHNLGTTSYSVIPVPRLSTADARLAAQNTNDFEVKTYTVGTTTLADAAISFYVQRD